MSENDSPTASQLPGVIPYFFYDVMGRMLPGAAAIFGILWFLSDTFVCGLKCKLQDVFPDASGAAYATAVVLLFLTFSHLLGVLVASIAYQLIDKGVSNKFEFLKKKTKLNAEGLRQFTGITSTEKLFARYEKYFGDKADPEELEKSSFTCAYYVMNISQNLGLMSSRADAELLGARSLLFVSAVFSLASFGKAVRHHLALPQTCPDLWAAVVAALIAWGSFLTYSYHRKKKTYCRFQMFLALTESEQRGARSR